MYLGEGHVERLILPAHSKKPVDIPFTTGASDVLKAVWNLIRSGEKVDEVKIKLWANIPIRLLGVVEVGSFTVNYEHIIEYELIPGATIRGRISLRWSSVEAYVGQLVKTIITVRGPIEAHVVAYVIMDKILLPDETIIEKDFGYISVPHGTCKELVIEFIPERPSEGLVKGYYIKVLVNGIEIVQPDSYPPRLKVLKYPTGTTVSTTQPIVITTTTVETTTVATTIPTPTTTVVTTVRVGRVKILDITWMVNGMQRYIASKGDLIEALVRIHAVGPVEGELKIVVMKDYRLLPDEELISHTEFIELDIDEEVTRVYRLEFIAEDNPLAVKGYYIIVYFNSEKVYEMPSSYPPRLKLTLSGSW